MSKELKVRTINYWNVKEGVAYLTVNNMFNQIKTLAIELEKDYLPVIKTFVDDGKTIEELREWFRESGPEKEIRDFYFNQVILGIVPVDEILEELFSWFQYQYKINEGLKEQAEWMLAQEND